jgi:kynureninase
MDVTRAHALERDAADDLAGFRGEFHFPNAGKSIYLCGHSLGLAPRAAARLVNEELEAWQHLGVEGHFDSPRPWLSYHEQLASALAHLGGALPDEVVAMNSLSVNLHLMLASFYRPTPARHKILIEGSAFPSDRYAVESHLRWHGYDPRESLIVFGSDERSELIDERTLCNLIARDGADIATILWPGVQYLTGQLFDLHNIASVARSMGCRIGFDLAHAIGNVPLELHASDADFAVWCGYKYLNGGPGAIGGCFVHERHARDSSLPRLAGWWGHDKSSRFEMPPEFSAIPGAQGWQVSNPPILSAAPLLASLEIFERAGIERLRRKSLMLTLYFADLLRARLPDAITIVTPLADDEHGAQLSLRLNCSPGDAKRVQNRLQAAHAFCDWREPDIIRAAAAPLYNSFADVWDFVATLEQALQ